MAGMLWGIAAAGVGVYICISFSYGESPLWRMIGQIINLQIIVAFGLGCVVHAIQSK